MEPVTIAATIAGLIFTEAVKQPGKALGEAASKKIAQAITIIREQFQKDEIGGVLKRAEENPETKNIQKFEEELVSVMEIDKNQDFTQQLRKLVEELKKEGVIPDSNKEAPEGKYITSAEKIIGSAIGDNPTVTNGDINL